MALGFLFCAAFVVISFSLRKMPDSDRALIRADKLMLTAVQAQKSN